MVTRVHLHSMATAHMASPRIVEKAGGRKEPEARRCRFSVPLADRAAGHAEGDKDRGSSGLGTGEAERLSRMTVPRNLSDERAKRPGFGI